MRVLSIIQKQVFLCVLCASAVNLVSAVQAQQLLTPDDAVSIALKNNYDILVAHNAAEIAKVNNTPGNAGMLPSVGVNGSENFSINSLDQKPQSGPELKSNDARSNSFSAAAILSWTLFDGGRMFVTKRKLSEIEDLGGIQYKDRVLQTVYNVTVAYYDVVRQKQQLVSFNDVIAYNQERVTILQTSFNAGLSPKTSILQAKIDLNVIRESVIRQQTVITEAKRTLNLLLARDANTAFDVADSIPLGYTPDRTGLLEKIYSSNTNVREVQKQVAVARLSLKETTALGLPRITLNGGYQIAQSDNTAGSVLMNRSSGPMIGGTVSIPLYQSGNVMRQITTARLQLKSTEAELENVKLETSVMLQNLLDEFDNQRQLLAIEKDNTALAKENLDISLARLKQGQSTSLELKQAEQSYEDALTRLLDIEYNLKVAETKLKQLLALL
jgi:outer membrane protein